MGTSFLTQASNKRSMALDLKQERDRDILKALVKTADVFVENYRPGAFEALGLGYDALSAINPRLIYASFSAFGQNGPRGQQTAYDHVIQATSGIMAMTGTKDVHPVKIGAPAVDYVTGMTGAFALSAALYQRERTGKGQRIDMAMLDVAMILMASHVTGYLRNGAHPKPHGNRHPHATNGAFAAKDGTLVMLGASNIRQQKRLWKVLGRPDMAKKTNDERDADHDREIAVLEEIMTTRTADEWEEFLQARHVPAARVRTMGEAIADPQIAARGVIHRHAKGNGMEGSFGVPLAAFTFAHGGPHIDQPAADARPAQRRDSGRAWIWSKAKCAGEGLQACTGMRPARPSAPNVAHAQPWASYVAANVPPCTSQQEKNSLRFGGGVWRLRPLTTISPSAMT